MDVLLAAQKVGPKGQAIGLDMSTVGLVEVKPRYDNHQSRIWLL
jgi:hypothetical protein